jgi:hypothetical protein
MPILDLQRSVRQVGRIRLGELAATRSGKQAPTKLETFRLSSPQRQPIELAARLYGGAVTEMRSDKSDDRWQVTTTATSIPVVIPPASHLSQWYEEWGGAGCERRCDGRNMIVAAGRAVDKPCECDPENRVCRMTTRLSLILPELEALGVWRLDTKGYNAATELAAAADLCAVASSRGIPIPARLDLEQRTRRGRDENGRPETKKFAVPVLSVDVSLPQAQAILGRGDTSAGELQRAPAPVTVKGESTVFVAEMNGPSQRTMLGQPVPAELPPPAPADIPAPRTADAYQKAQEPPQEPAERPAAGPGMTEAQRYAASLSGKLTNDQRHDLYRIATGDPTARYGSLSGRHRNQVARWARQIEAGELTLHTYPSGPALINTEDTVVASAITEPEAGQLPIQEPAQ